MGKAWLETSLPGTQPGRTKTLSLGEHAIPAFEGPSMGQCGRSIYSEETRG